jgi:hypothetical protein
MALVFDYNTRIITIPKADLLLVQTLPSEVRQLNINDFRLWLHDEQDDERGIVFVEMFENQPPKTISGVTLARVLEILSPWKVEFDDTGGADLYAVNIVGGNSNLADVVVKNTVGVNTANSAGLQDPFALQSGAFQGEIALDTVSGSSGTSFPRGTRAFPTNNIVDAIAIAETRGLRTIRVLRSFTLSSGDFSDGYTFTADNTLIEIVLDTAPDITNCVFRNCTISGVLDGNNQFVECSVLNVNMFNGAISRCGLGGTVTLGGGDNSNFIDCHSEIAGGIFSPTINLGGAAGNDLVVRNYHGGLTLTNCTTAIEASLDFSSGKVTLESSLTAGAFTLRGIASVFDNSAGATVNDNTIQSASERADFHTSVAVDTIVGTAGTVFPMGTGSNPVNNLTDALAIAARVGLSSLTIQDGTIVATASHNLDSFGIKGDKAGEPAIVLAGASTLKTGFSDVIAIGATTGTATFRDCIMGAAGQTVTVFDGVGFNCIVIADTITLNNSLTTRGFAFTDCEFAKVGDTAVAIDCNTNSKFSFRSCSGKVTIGNLKDAAITNSLDMISGDVEILASCTAGTIVVRGIAKVTDNSTGTTVVIDETTSTSGGGWGEIIEGTLSAADILRLLMSTLINDAVYEQQENGDLRVTYRDADGVKDRFAIAYNSLNKTLDKAGVDAT